MIKCVTFLILGFFQTAPTRLLGQSRPTLKNAIYIESTTGNKYPFPYIDSVFGTGTTIIHIDSTKVIGGVPFCYIHFFDLHMVGDVTKSAAYQKSVGRNIYTNPGPFAPYRQLIKDSLIGKVCLLHFWATTCGPCIRSLAEFKTVFKDYLDHHQMQILNFSEENDALVGAFLYKYSTEHFPGIFIPSADSLCSQLEISGWPTLMIVDKTGVITHFFEGQGTNIAQIQNAVRKDLQ
jgi:thiol-disulfide isomerase/thioredoxin